MIIDTFTFSTELDLLEIRLAELGELVDRFIICEAEVTHKGDPKPLYFARNAKRFSRWKNQIVHLVAKPMPTGINPWLRERFQRNYIQDNFDFRASDLVIHGDADEIPNVQAVGHCYLGHEWKAPFGALEMQSHRYFFNYRDYDFMKNNFRMWRATRIGLYSRLDGMKFNEWREWPGYDELKPAWEGRIDKIKNGGWHLTWMGGQESIGRKLNSTCDWCNPSRAEFEQGLKTGLPPQREEYALRKVELNGYLPRAISDNAALWIKRGYIKE